MSSAAARALAIIDAFDEASTALTMQEISERIGVPKATVFRLLETLETGGFLLRHDDQRYSLSLKFLRLAGLVPRAASLRAIARPKLEELSALTGETATLNTVLGHERVCIEAVNTWAPLMAIARVGDRVPLLFGATNRILLAFMDDAHRTTALDELERTHTFNRSALERELRQFRDQGYALTRNQRVNGITAIAVPLFSADGHAENCLALTGPGVRVQPREAELIKIVCAVGAEITQRLGGKPLAPNARVARKTTGKPVVKPAPK